VGEFAHQNKAPQLSKTYYSKYGGDMEWRLLLFPGETCWMVDGGKASTKTGNFI